MKRLIVFVVSLLALALAPPALAHHPVGSASQACDGEQVVLAATFENPGFDTAVTATDSQAGDLGTKSAPATFTATFPVHERPAGTITFDWVAEHDSGTVTASYEAASGCEATPPPPTTTTTTTTTPPPSPPSGHNNHGGPPPPPPPSPQAPSPASASSTLPFSGLPLGRMALAGLCLLGVGIGLRKVTRHEPQARQS